MNVSRVDREREFTCVSMNLCLVIIVEIYTDDSTMVPVCRGLKADVRQVVDSRQ